MKKFLNSPDSVANKALRHYFDDMILPESDTFSAPSSHDLGLKTSALLKNTAVTATSSSTDFAPNNIALQKKLQQAEQLLVKASCIDELPTHAKHTSHELADTLKQDPVIISHQKDISDDKENRPNADSTNISNETTRLTRNLSISLKDSLPYRFQVLLCDIDNITIAIPLVELGGIHQLSKLTNMANQPSWCKGILIKGNDRYTCIDAAAWLLPQHNKGIAQQREYKFAVQLGKSPYALCCNNISTTVDVCKDDIKWRDNTTSRLWLSGFLEQKMCALIDGAHMLEEVLA